VEAIELAKRLVAENSNYFMLNQFENESNVAAHYENTAREIWEDLNGEVDCVVGGIGTGGSLMGMAKFFKERRPSVRMIGVTGRGEEIDGTISQELYPSLLLDRSLID